MNRSIFTSFTILCLLSILFLMGCKISVKAELISLYVDDDNVTGHWDGTKEYPYQNITSALENAADGYTIFVRTGMYYENVIVNKRVSLIGEDRDSTIVDGNEIGTVISIIGANSVYISDFTIRRSGHEYYDRGIYVDHSSGNHIGHNTIINNYDGVGFYYSGDNVVSGNTITNNNNGVSLYYSGDNVVSGNTITNNHNDGVSLYYSGDNVVSGNTITNNHNGVYLALDSRNNTFYLNNFNNIYQVWTDLTSVWDDGDEGNYWSDYLGQDLNGDGIGDTPYVIDVNNQDNYPLMGVVLYFYVAWGNKTYHITTICNSTISEFRLEIGLETGNKIIRFNVTGKDGTVGFCRIIIPIELMSYHYVILVDDEEILPTPLEDISNEMYAHLCFVYKHSSHTITIISSLARKLEADLYNLNATYHTLLGNYSELQQSYQELNKSYQDHLINYSVLLGNYSELQQSYQKYLFDYSENVHNIRTLMYIFATTTAIFLIITIYLSKRAHGMSAFFGGKTLDRSESRD